MADRNVPAADVKAHGVIEALVAIVNQLSAAVAELDADATGGGVVSTLPDSIVLLNGNTPE